MIKTFKSYIFEGLSSVLYHYTSIINASKILKDDKFILTSDVGTPSESNLAKPKKYYYLSTTRHKLGGYSSDPTYKYIMIVLDGKKLGERYKGSPVDYWSGDPIYKTDRSKSEAEDRIYNDKPIIPNAVKYIKEIHVLLDENLMDLEIFQSKALRNVYKISIQKKIPIYFYFDKKNFLLQNKNKSVDIDLNQLRILTEPDRKKMFLKHQPFDVFEELYYTPVKNEKKLSKEASKLLYKLKFGIHNYQIKDILSTLEVNLHNNRTDPSIDKLIKIFKKEKIRDPRDFLNLLIDKWGMWEK